MREIVQDDAHRRACQPGAIRRESRTEAGVTAEARMKPCATCALMHVGR